jgi:hypothetical protein
MSETAMILHAIGLLFLLMWIIILIDRSENFSDQASINNELVAGKQDTDRLIFDFYNKVQMDLSKTDIESILGNVSEVDEDGLHTYIDCDTGYGVSIRYNARGQVTLKGIATPEGCEKLISVCHANVTSSQLDNISRGMTYDWVTVLLGGEGVEVVCAANPLDHEKPLYGMAWINADGTAITVQFDGQNGCVYAAKYREK